MSELVDWLRVQLDEDEWWAREASRDPFGRSTPTGEHWIWEDEVTDQPVTIDPVGGGEYLIGDDWAPVGLRSVEEYRSTTDLYSLNHLVVRGQDELQHEVAGHIARWDPARVMVEVEAKRRILDRYVELMAEVAHWRARGDEDAAPVATAWAYEQVVDLLALPYAGRPGYREEWAPGGQAPSDS